MNLSDIQKEISALEYELGSVENKRDELKTKLSKAKSQAFITSNQITKDQVEHSSGDGKPWFGEIRRFAHWLEANSDKPWCEWNGLIYQTSEIVAGRMAREATGRYQDLGNL